MRLRHFDFLRFVAACIVFIGHLFLYIEIPPERKVIEMLSAPLKSGALAVDFFFTLSGFVLMSSLLKMKEVQSSIWIARRFMRLLPVYYCGLAIGIFISFLYASAKSQSLNYFNILISLLGIQALWKDYALSFNSPLWSLSVEMILTPLIILGYKFQKKIYYLSSISILLFCMFPENVLTRSAPFFLLGSSIAIKQNWKLFPQYRQIMWNWWPLFYFGYIYVMKLSKFESYLLFTLEIVLFALVFVLYSNIEPRKIEKFIAEHLGRRSYVIYAVHGPLIGLIGSLIKPQILSEVLLFCVLSVGTVALISEFIYRVVEIPTLKFLSESKT